MIAYYIIKTKKYREELKFIKIFITKTFTKTFLEKIQNYENFILIDIQMIDI